MANRSPLGATAVEAPPRGAPAGFQGTNVPWRVGSGEGRALSGAQRQNTKDQRNEP